MSLRQDLIEAAGRAIVNSDGANPDSFSEIVERNGTAALDAMLDTLEANADEWFEAWIDWADPESGDPKFVGLIAALRSDD